MEHKLKKEAYSMRQSFSKKFIEIHQSVLAVSLMSFHNLALECVCSSFKSSQSQELCFLSASSHEYFLQRTAPLLQTPRLVWQKKLSSGKIFS